MEGLGPGEGVLILRLIMLFRKLIEIASGLDMLKGLVLSLRIESINSLGDRSLFKGFAQLFSSIREQTRSSN